MQPGCGSCKYIHTYQFSMLKTKGYDGGSFNNILKISNNCLPIPLYHYHSTYHIKTCSFLYYIFSSAIACSHHRCADYYTESIRTQVGFYGRKCRSYLYYIFGLCSGEAATTLAGAHCGKDTRGMYFVKTNSKYPYARGRQHDDHNVGRALGIETN
jgi:Lipase